jgi:hypothetical protein
MQQMLACSGTMEVEWSRTKAVIDCQAATLAIS